MRQIRTDLWETRVDSPFPGLTTHAYLWTRQPDGPAEHAGALAHAGALEHDNVLFYSPATEADFEALDHLGGVSHQYLSHQDEAGPNLARIRERFGARLHAPAAENHAISAHSHIDVPLSGRHVDSTGIEVVPTPGHTVGSTCYLVTLSDGARVLFTGDTMFRGADGRWAAGFIPPISDAQTLAASLQILRTLAPDVVISSAFAGDSAVHVLGGDVWSDWVDHAAAGLRTAV
ncbi:MAG: Zn-dependent hydrolase [Mycobacterium sp.]|jgi:glyoxylase-like metal-dependent hydrolase (beta-lactamase superfamily II)|nr:Zn-dependent hydrolase [Mycobacterium sp.]